MGVGMGEKDKSKPSDVVDLDPHEWKSEREKPRQALFGKNLWPFIVGAITVYAMAWLKTYYHFHLF